MLRKNLVVALLAFVVLSGQCAFAQKPKDRLLRIVTELQNKEKAAWDELAKKRELAAEACKKLAEADAAVSAAAEAKMKAEVESKCASQMTRDAEQRRKDALDEYDRIKAVIEGGTVPDPFGYNSLMDRVKEAEDAYFEARETTNAARSEGKLQEEIDGLLKKEEEAKGTFDNLKEELEQAKMDAESAEKEIFAAEKDLTAARAESAAGIEAYTAALEELKKAESLAAKARKKKEAAEKLVKIAKTEHEAIQDQLELARTTLQNRNLLGIYSDRIGALEVHSEGYDQQLQSVKDETAKIKKAVIAVNSKADVNRHSIAKLDTRIGKVEVRVATLEKRVKALEDTMSSVQEALAKAIAECKTSEKNDPHLLQMQSLQEQVTILQNRDREFSDMEVQKLNGLIASAMKKFGFVQVQYQQSYSGGNRCRWFRRS